MGLDAPASKVVVRSPRNSRSGCYAPSFLMMNWAVILCAFITLVVRVPSNTGKHFLIETKEPSYPDYEQEAGSDYCRRFCFGDMNWGIWNSHHENVTEIHNQDEYVGNFESPDLEPARK